MRTTEWKELKFEAALEAARGRWRGERLAETTVLAYGRYLRRLEREIGPLVGGDGAALRRRLVAWRSRMQDRNDAGKVATSTIGGDLGALRAFYRALIESGLAADDPTEAVQAVVRERRRPRPVPLPDADRICAQPDASTLDGLRDRTILECMRHGLRQNEFVRLNLGGVEFDEKNARIVLRFAAKARASRPRERDIPLSAEGTDLFARYLLETYAPDAAATWLAEAADRDPEGTARAWLLDALRRLLKRLKPDAAQPVFRTETGRRLYQVWVNRMYAKHREAAGVDARWTPHTFRHRFCTQLLESGKDPRRSMRLSGHTDIRSLMQYTEVTLDQAAADVDAIGSAPIREAR
jgi:site-specific recombinase XerD